MGVAIGMAQQPEQHIEHDGGTRIADMGEVVNRGAADIQADMFGIERDEIVLALGQAVVESQSHDKSPEGDGKVANNEGEQKGFCGLSRKSKSG
jgi:2-methylcitrate dehydratase PrpD